MPISTAIIKTTTMISMSVNPPSVLRSTTLRIGVPFSREGRAIWPAPAPLLVR